MRRLLASHRSHCAHWFPIRQTSESVSSLNPTRFKEATTRTSRTGPKQLNNNNTNKARQMQRRPAYATQVRLSGHTSLAPPIRAVRVFPVYLTHYLVQLTDEIRTGATGLLPLSTLIFKAQGYHRNCSLI